MRYLKETLFLDRKGVPIHIEESGGVVDATVGRILTLIAENYVPQAGKTLTHREIHRLNKAQDTLEKGPKNGYYLFDDAEFQILKQVVEWLAPVINVKELMRSCDRLIDALEAATTEEPPCQTSQLPASEQPEPS